MLILLSKRNKYGKWNHAVCTSHVKIFYKYYHILWLNKINNPPQKPSPLHAIRDSQTFHTRIVNNKQLWQTHSSTPKCCPFSCGMLGPIQGHRSRTFSQHIIKEKKRKKGSLQKENIPVLIFTCLLPF